VENRKEHEAKLAEMRQELEATEADLKAMKSKEDWESVLAAAEKERDAALKTIADAEAMIEKRKTLSVELETSQTSI
jgi:hypothetical protein